VRVVWFAALLGGCYRPPSELACNVLCESPGTCPDGLECTAPGMPCAPMGQTCGEPVIDAPVDTAPPFLCPGGTAFGATDVVKICLPTATVDALPAVDTIGGINTDACPGSMEQFDGISFCLIAARTLNVVGGTFSGSLPLVLLGVDSIHLLDGAALDASSAGNKAGPAVNVPASDCGTRDGTASGANSPNVGASGGAGGRWNGDAGNGGPGDAPNAMGATISEAIAPPLGLRAGCAGGKGGTTPTQLGGGPGLPGGAMFLISPITIVLDPNTKINASGSGGRFANPSSGGGGAGSGGLIGLDTPLLDIHVTAQVFALGGSGSPGGSDGGPGPVGAEATGATVAQRAPETVNGCAGHGGAGSTLLGKGEDGTQGACTDGRSGGGGGGGSGYIVLSAPAPAGSMANFAPVPIVR
jgi:hypothetical protein